MNNTNKHYSFVTQTQMVDTPVSELYSLDLYIYMYHIV